jgi:hypothetical protein
LWWRRRRAGARRRRRSRAGARRRRRRADARRNRSGARGRGGRRRAGARRRRCSGRPSPAGAASYRSTFAVASGHPRGPGTPGRRSAEYGEGSERPVRGRGLGPGGTVQAHGRDLGG